PSSSSRSLIGCLCFGIRIATVRDAVASEIELHQGAYAMSARLAPVEPPYPDHVASMLQRLMGPNLEAPPLALFRTLAHHEALLDRFRQVGSTLLSHGRLPAADR